MFSSDGILISASTAPHCGILGEGFTDTEIGADTDTFQVFLKAPQQGTTDAEIKIPSVENPELKGSSFEAWNRSV